MRVIYAGLDIAAGKREHSVNNEKEVVISFCRGRILMS